MSTFITCKRCEGKGRLAHFGHVNNGVCLTCRGAGKVVKTRRVKTTVNSYQVVWDYSKIDYCQDDKARAEEILRSLIDMRVPAFIMCLQVVKTESVPV
jgi:RecJ-like exonuclease